MPKNKQIGILVYILSDYAAAMIAWTFFFLFRKVFIEGLDGVDVNVLLNDRNFILGVISIPLCWLVFHYITGTYTDIYRKSRFAEFLKTISICVVGVLIIFFILILDDTVVSHKNYYQSFFMLLALQTLTTTTGRMFILYRAKKHLTAGKAGYNTLIIGGNDKAVQLYEEIKDLRNYFGYLLLGYVNTNGEEKQEMANILSCVGHIDDLESIISTHKIEEVIIAIEVTEHHRLNNIINRLTDENVVIKIIPDMYDILLGSVKMNHVLGAALIEIYPEQMPKWQKIVKRIIDVIVSACALIILSPIMIYAAISVRMSSKGPILYKQERIGLGGKPFTMFKFRSMVEHAESSGPALSSQNDSRITSWGKVMRKWRIDELPQFYNVLVGDMSLVGHRPERKFYIDQIIEKAPHYKHLRKVKPGITSMGMVKFGYAENVDQMIERLKFDMIYVENTSLGLDFKILVYTLLTILQGRGK